MNDTILADSIAHIPHLAAFDLIVKKRFSELELDKLLVYLIDTVDASALPHLAKQFDVLGYKGYRLATTETEQREIIKRAIELHRYKGTLWAVKEALKSIGFGSAVVEEHVEGHWAKFRVTIELGGRTLNIREIDDLVKMVTEYKNERSWLADLSYTIEFTDNISPVDNSNEGPAEINNDKLFVGGNFKYDGSHYYNGDRNYSQDTDILTIQII
jgi:phage tail P2-like protein